MDASSPSRVWSRAWVWSLGAGAGALLAYYVFPSNARQNAIQLIATGAAAIAMFAVFVRRPVRRLAFLLLACGFTSWTAGQFFWIWMEDIRHLEAPAVSFADLGYLAAVPPLIVGTWMLVSARTGRNLWALVDSSIIAIGFGLLLWTFLVEPAFQRSADSLLARLVATAYPASEICLVALGARLAVTRGRRPPALWLLVGGLASLFVADVGYSIEVLRDTYQTGHPIDAGWVLFGVLGVTAALHPSIAHLGAAVPRDDGAGAPKIRLGLLALAAALAPVDSLLVLRRGHNVSDGIIATIVLVALVMVRLTGLNRRLEGTVVELESTRAEREELMKRIVRVADDQRSELALALHDGPVQQLSAVSMQLDRIVRTGERSTLGGVVSSLRDSIRRLRGLMSELNAPALLERGLPGAIGDLATTFTSDTGIACDIDEMITERLDAPTETALFRIVREALTNVKKHADAHRVHVRVGRLEGSIQMDIEDDGVGLREPTVDANLHLGLDIMRERARSVGGVCEITTLPGGGTRVRVRVPARRAPAASRVPA